MKYVSCWISGFLGFSIFTFVQSKITVNGLILPYYFPCLSMHCLTLSIYIISNGSVLLNTVLLTFNREVNSVNNPPVFMINNWKPYISTLDCHILWIDIEIVTHFWTSSEYPQCIRSCPWISFKKWRKELIYEIGIK